MSGSDGTRTHDLRIDSHLPRVRRGSSGSRYVLHGGDLDPLAIQRRPGFASGFGVVGLEIGLQAVPGARALQEGNQSDPPQPSARLPDIPHPRGSLGREEDVSVRPSMTSSRPGPLSIDRFEGAHEGVHGPGITGFDPGSERRNCVLDPRGSTPGNLSLASNCSISPRG